jgi:hypothetical protein
MMTTNAHLDADPAALYGVQTRRLNEQVRRNPERFPADFMFQRTNQETANLKSQIATSSWGGSRKPPLAFTAHGALMAAAVLNSAHAVEMSPYVVDPTEAPVRCDPGVDGPTCAGKAAHRLRRTRGQDKK